MKLLKIEALNHQKSQTKQRKEGLRIIKGYPKVLKKPYNKLMKKNNAKVLKRVMAQKVLECCLTFYSLDMNNAKLKTRA